MAYNKSYDGPGTSGCSKESGGISGYQTVYGGPGTSDNSNGRGGFGTSSYNKGCDELETSCVNIAVLGRTGAQTDRCVKAIFHTCDVAMGGDFRIHHNVSLSHIEQRMNFLRECKPRSSSDESRMSVDSDTQLSEYVDSEDESRDGGSIHSRNDRSSVLHPQSPCPSQHMKKLKTGLSEDYCQSTVSYESGESSRRQSAGGSQAADPRFPIVDVYELPWSSSAADLLYNRYLPAQTIYILVLDTDSLSTTKTLPVDYNKILMLAETHRSHSSKLKLILAATSDRFQAGQKSMRDRDNKNHATNAFNLLKKNLKGSSSELVLNVVLEESEDLEKLRGAINDVVATHPYRETCDVVRTVSNLIHKGKRCVSKIAFQEELHRTIKPDLVKRIDIDQVLKKLVQENKVVVAEDSSIEHLKCEQGSSSKDERNQLIWLRPELLFEIYNQMVSELGGNHMLVSSSDVENAFSVISEYTHNVAKAEVDLHTFLSLMQQLRLLIQSQTGSFLLPLEFQPYSRVGHDIFPSPADPCTITPTLRLTLADYRTGILDFAYQIIASRFLQKGYLPANSGKYVLLYRDILAFTLWKGSPLRLIISIKELNVHVVLVNYEGASKPFDQRVCEEIRCLVSQSLEEVLLSRLPSLKGLPVRQNWGSAENHRADSIFIYSIRCPEATGRLDGDQGWIAKGELEQSASYSCSCRQGIPHPHQVKSKDLLGVWFPKEILAAVSRDAPVQMEVQTASEVSSTILTPQVMAKLAYTLGENWQTFLVSEGLSQTQIDLITEAPKSAVKARYDGLCEWLNLKEEDQGRIDVSILRGALRKYRPVRVEWDEFDKIVEGMSH